MFHRSSITEDAPTEPEWPAGTRPMSVAWDDDDVQVMLDADVWHRQAHGIPETACGRKIDYLLTLGIRASSYLGKLCLDGCFSQHELTTIAPRLTAQHEKEQEVAINKISEDARRRVLDSESRRARGKPKKEK